VELLELQLKEAFEREENQKKVHDTLIHAFQNDAGTSQLRMNSKELELQKKEVLELRCEYECQLKDYKQKVF